ncbi:hypothetical protein DV736_g2116, partial [Chaetothyriales sp. CBS 134916]
MLLLLSAWACLLLLSSHTNAQLAPRDYAANDYFAVHLQPDAWPNEIAQRLGARNEGPLGELPDHYTFSCPKAASERVHQTLQDLKQRRRLLRGRHSVAPTVAERSSGLDSVLWSDKQHLRRRHVKRIPPRPPPSLPRQHQAPPQSQPEQADGQLDQAQQEAIQRLNAIASQLNIQDPIFKQQWHLFNPLQLGHDLNVTGLWLEGITGNGTISAVVDDGLDMHSNDLKDNYFADGSWDFNDNTAEPRPRLYDDKHGTRCAGEIAAVRNNACGVGMAYDSRVAGIRILSAPISDEDEASAVNYRMQDNQIYSCSWGPPDDGATMDAPSLLIKRAIVNGIQRGRRGLGSVFVFAAGNGASAGDNCNFDGYTNSIYSITVGGIDRNGDHPYYSEACSAQLVVTYSSGHGDAIHTTDVGKDKCSDGHGGTSAAGPLVVGTIALALSVRPELSWRDLQYLCLHTAVPIHLDDGDWQDTALGKKFSHTYGYGKVDAYAFVQAAKAWDLVKPQAWYHSAWISVQHAIPQGDQGLAASFHVTADALTAANLDRLEHVTVTMNVNHTRRGDLSVELRSPAGRTSHLSVSRPNDNEASGYHDWNFMSVVHWGETAVGTWTVIVKDTVDNDHTGRFIDWRLNLWGECIDPSKQELRPLPDEHDDDHDMATASVTTTSIDSATPPTPLPANPSDHIDPIGLIIAFCTGLAIYFLLRRRRSQSNARDGYEFEMHHHETVNPVQKMVASSSLTRSPAHPTQAVPKEAADSPEANIGRLRSSLPDSPPPTQSSTPTGKPQYDQIRLIEEKARNSIHVDYASNSGSVADEQRKLRKHGGTRLNTELAQYFPNFHDMLSLEPQEPQSLTAKTTLVLLDDTPDYIPPVARKDRFGARKALHDTTIIDLALAQPVTAHDPMSEQIYDKIHRKHERHEKQMKNGDRERAQHEKYQLERLLDELRGPDWLRTLGISGITETEKKRYEPKRQLFVRETQAMIEKFKWWKEEEKRRRLERQQELREEAAPPNSSEIDALAAQQLLEEAKSANRGKRTTALDTVVPAPATPFTSFFEKRHLRDAAVSGRQRSRTVLAFGYPLPELEHDHDFALPATILTDDAIKSSQRLRRRRRRDVDQSPRAARSPVLS